MGIMAMSATRVSIIIPTFNSTALVAEAVGSVLAQRVGTIEIIVVDDGSTDDTAQRLARFGDRVQYVYQRNSGVAAARNAGLARADGELVAFLDADDVWHPNKLQIQLDRLDRRPDLGLIGTGAFSWPAPRVPEIMLDVAPPAVPVTRDELMVKNRFITSSVVLRRSVVERVGEFDTSLCGPEDHDYWLRAAAVTRTANLPLPLVGYRSVAGSLSKNAAAMELGMRQILDKLDARGAWNGSRSLRRRAYSYCNFSCAYMHGAAGDQRAALIRMLRSFAWYPLPYGRGETTVALARPRRLAVLALRLLRLMPDEPLYSVAHRSANNSGSFP